MTYTLSVTLMVPCGKTKEADKHHVATYACVTIVYACVASLGIYFTLNKCFVSKYL